MLPVYHYAENKGLYVVKSGRSFQGARPTWLHMAASAAVSAVGMVYTLVKVSFTNCCRVEHVEFIQISYKYSRHRLFAIAYIIYTLYAVSIYKL